MVIVFVPGFFPDLWTRWLVVTMQMTRKESSEKFDKFQGKLGGKNAHIWEWRIKFCDVIPGFEISSIEQYGPFETAYIQASALTTLSQTNTYIDTKV